MLARFSTITTIQNSKVWINSLDEII